MLFNGRGGNGLNCQDQTARALWGGSRDSKSYRLRFVQGWTLDTTTCVETEVGDRADGRGRGGG